jgi:hypothetical protein
MKKRKKIIFMAVIIWLLIVVVVAAGLISLGSGRTVSPGITVTGIKSGVEKQDNYILARVKDRYYEITPSNDFMQTFLFDEWEQATGIPSDEEVVISLQFAELLVVDIYESGAIAAYDGYASRNYRAFAYYEMPKMTVEKISDFLEKNAIPHKMGDGTISDSTFRHN